MIKIFFWLLACILIFMCYAFNKDKIITFSAVVIGETPYIEQVPGFPDSLVIDSVRYIQIVNNELFVEKLQMDSYLFHINKIECLGDSIIHFSIDKEGGWFEYSRGEKIRWTNFFSEYQYTDICITKNPGSLLWTIKYDNKIQMDCRLIRNEDIKRSKMPILLYKNDD